MAGIGGISTFFTSVWSNPQNYFLAPELLIFLTAFIPIILIYLIRPRPRKQVFPSLMFLMGEKGKFKRNSFLRQLLRNLMLLLQLLIVLFFVLALARPYIEQSFFVSPESTVVVLDTSASMQTWVTPIDTRFSKAKDLTKQHLSETNSLILAGRTPSIHLRDASRQAAIDALQNVEPTDGTTNLRDGMVLAGELLQGEEGTIIVVSDFVETNANVDLSVVKSTLEARGYTVEFVSVHTQANNIGITDVQIDELFTTVFIKNFNDQQEQITLHIGEEQEQLTLEPKSTEVKAFTTPSGKFTVSIEEKDDFPIDNKVHLSFPDSGAISVLMITNQETRSPYIELAIASVPNVKVTKAFPPVIPEMNFDVILLKDVDPSLLLQGKIEEIREAVRKGTLFIIANQENLFSMDFQGMLPVSYNKALEKTIIPTINDNHQFMSDVSIGRIDKGVQMDLIQNATVLAHWNDHPLITLQTRDRGAILFYGLFDRSSDFITTPSYPIFWGNVIELVKERKSASFLNVHTGGVIPFGESTYVRTPSGDQQTTSLSLNKAGLYAFDEIVLAANLISERESDVSAPVNIKEGLAIEENTEQKELLEDKEVTLYVLLIALTLLILELCFLKYRGDF